MVALHQDSIIILDSLANFQRCHDLGIIISRPLRPKPAGKW